MSFLRRRGVLPWALLGPGIVWLLVFFAAPMGYMAYVSLQEGSIEEGFSFTWNFGVYPDAMSNYSEQFVRSFLYAGISTVIALLVAYPLAYAIAFHGGRWRNALLLAVIAPFFTTYLIRTLSWQTILDDASPTVDFMRTIGLIADDGRLLQTSGSVIAGITYNF